MHVTANCRMHLIYVKIKFHFIVKLTEIPALPADDVILICVFNCYFSISDAHKPLFNPLVNMFCILLLLFIVDGETRRIE